MHSNKYTILYAIGFTTIVAVILAVVATGLRPIQEANEAQAKRKAILQSVMDVETIAPEELESKYEEYITEKVINAQGEEVANASAFDMNIRKEAKKSEDERLFPMFVYDDGSRTNYIVPMQGLGLWGPISAYLALEEDLNTIYGVVFDHEKETPGLGAEIKTDSFQEQYKGKKIYEPNGSFASVAVLKGSGNDIDGKPHLVDGVSGATITSDGVTNMFRDELNNYSSYFNKIRS